MRRRNLIIFGLFLAVTVVIVIGVYFGLIRRRQGGLLTPLPELRIQIVHATDEGDWISSAAERFNAEKHVLNGQQIVVELIGLDSVEAYLDIKEGRLRPTAWSPASSFWANLLNADWSVEHGTDLVMYVGQYQATPLVLSPMVFVMWQDRAQVFESSLGTPDWDTIQQAVSLPNGWSDLGGDPNWGLVKFGLADPLYSNAGMSALALATYHFYGKTRGLTVGDITTDEYTQWVEPLWASTVGGYERASSDLMKNMVLYGPSTYDVIMVYENLVAAQMKNAPGRWGSELRVYYPELNLWNDHPFCILMGEWSSADQKDAALEFQRFLLSEEMQQEALRQGFRPANVDVPVINEDPENPFNRHQAQGLEVQIPRINLVEVPSAEVIKALQLKFQRLQP